MESPLNSYLQDVSRYPLLDRQQEIELSKKIREGSDQALEKLVCCNLRLVVWIALRIQRQKDPLFMDLVSEGNLGLVAAGRRYNAETGASFATYAYFWIVQRILRALEHNANTVRVPSSRWAKARLVRRLLDAHRSNGREGDTQFNDLAAEIGLDTSSVEQLLGSVSQNLSLDAPLQPDSGLCLMDLIPDESLRGVGVNLQREDLCCLVAKALESLSPREREIIERRYGLRGSGGQTLQEVGRSVGISRNRVQFLQAQGLRKLRAFLDAQAGQLSSEVADF
jgi:RNA polymerase primary sigma factor